MGTQVPNLSWLRTFEAAARLLNFTAAGHELGLTQTAVSLHIKALETKLGCDLFVRRPRNLKLTELGNAYLPPVRKALEDLSLSTLGLFGPEMTRAITVRVPISTAVLWLAPQLGVFQALHPGVAVRLVSTIWADSIADDDVDVDIRSGHGNWPGLKVEKLSEESITPVCSADWAKAITGPADLPDQSLIHILGLEDTWSRYFDQHGIATPQQFEVCVDTTIAALEMVAAGNGIAAIMTRYADAAIAAGRPIAKVGQPVPFGQSHYLVEKADHGPPRPEISAFTDWLRKRFSDGEAYPRN